jgi:hypothetical protein
LVIAIVIVPNNVVDLVGNIMAFFRSLEDLLSDIRGGASCREPLTTNVSTDLAGCGSCLGTNFSTSCRYLGTGSCGGCGTGGCGGCGAGYGFPYTHCGIDDSGNEWHFVLHWFLFKARQIRLQGEVSVIHGNGHLRDYR